MKVSASIPIKATKEEIWSVITDIEHSDTNISGINKIEILNKPVIGLEGLKWRETRTMFKKEATEVMWITEFEENKYYKTRAESHGMIYTSELKITEDNNQLILEMNFIGEPTSVMGKIMSGVFGILMSSSTKKALLLDLVDIKKVVEQGLTK